MKNIAEITVDGKKTVCQIGQRLSECISRELPCGGHGTCGKCKVIAHGSLSPISEREAATLTEKEIRNGVRLACRTIVLGSCTVETLIPSQDEKEYIVVDGAKQGSETHEKFVSCGVSLDIGTTTLAARLYGEGGKILATSARINPQTVFGADVVSRIESAVNGKLSELQALVTDAIDEMLLEMSNEASISVSDIKSLVITGNTAMLQFLTAEPADNLARAPFTLNRPFGETLSAGEIGLRSLGGDTEIFLPHCISPFVGADTVCALIATNTCSGEDTKLLVDVGTNGEICLWHGGKLRVTSTAAGPCFEGVGISCGMRAKTGAVDRAWVEKGSLATHVIGDTAAKGVCGSGLVDVVASLITLGKIGEMGNLENGRQELSDGVFVEQSDITMVQMAKSAICAGIKTLLEELSVEKVENTDIAGGFGSSLNIESALKIGLLPESAGNIRPVGNAALDGASMLLLDRSLRKKCAEIASMAETADLATSDVFYNHYVSEMAF